MGWGELLPPQSVCSGPTQVYSLTSCQDLYFPRVNRQGSLVCPPECHDSCQAKRRGGSPPLPLPAIKETLDFPSCPSPLPVPLPICPRGVEASGGMLPGQLPATGIALDNQVIEEGCRRLRNLGGSHPPPHL